MLEKFLNTIHMEDDINEYKDLELIKVKVSNKKNLVSLYLKTNEMINIESFKKLESGVSSYFNANTLINIENTGRKDLYLDDYYKYFLPKYISYFEDRLKVNGERNNYIVVFNHGEEVQLQGCY